ncbi:hypothetical protein AN2340V1_4536 [Klebsiella variicola]|nr:hypothetical protein AN2340V1_4536 [Klebsiella variicola]CAH6216955.1 hypothetical protein AN2340V1_4536 [Klebsiella variicola]
MAARCALSGLQIPVYQTVTLFRRPAQVQRRRASCTMLRSHRCAGWRLTPYPAYGALYIKRLLCFVGPRKRSAAGQAVPICTRLRSHRCAGWRLTPYPAYGALYINRLLCFVGPRKRSAAGQSVPCSVPIVVPDGGYALSGLQSLVYQTVTLFRRPAQAQRRRAICTRLRSRRCAGWRLTPYPAYGALYIKRLLCFVGPRKRSAAGQAVPDSVPVAVPDGGCALSGLRKAAEPELSNGYSTP